MDFLKDLIVNAAIHAAIEMAEKDQERALQEMGIKAEIKIQVIKIDTDKILSMIENKNKGVISSKLGDIIFRASDSDDKE